MSRRLTHLLVPCAVFLAACADSVISPESENELTRDDTQFVAEMIDATSAGLLNDFFDSSQSDPAAGALFDHQPVVWTKTFERSRSCHDGGTLTVAGSSTSTRDGEAVTYDVESTGTKTRVACAHTRDGVLITLTGNAVWTHERHYANHAPTGFRITTYIGGFDWTKSTGKSGSCFYELTRTIDTAENTRSLTGTLCGDVVDRTGTWRTEKTAT